MPDFAFELISKAAILFIFNGGNQKFHLFYDNRDDVHLNVTDLLVTQNDATLSRDSWSRQNIRASILMSNLSCDV